MTVKTKKRRTPMKRNSGLKPFVPWGGASMKKRVKKTAHHKAPTRRSGLSTRRTTKNPVWSREYINRLPDSAFLLIEKGGHKDETGRTTPRDLRHLPVRNMQGAISESHVKNAISRAPQLKVAGLTPALVKQIQNKARKLLFFGTAKDGLAALKKPLPKARMAANRGRRGKKRNPTENEIMRAEEEVGYLLGDVDGTKDPAERRKLLAKARKIMRSAGLDKERDWMQQYNMRATKAKRTGKRNGGEADIHTGPFKGWESWSYGKDRIYERTWAGHIVQVAYNAYATPPHYILTIDDEEERRKTPTTYATPKAVLAAIKKAIGPLRKNTSKKPALRHKSSNAAKKVMGTRNARYFQTTGQPGEAELTLHFANNKSVDRNFPSLAKAETWLKAQIKKDIAKQLLARASVYVHGEGWTRYKRDRNGTWEKVPHTGAIQLFKVWSKNPTKKSTIAPLAAARTYIAALRNADKKAYAKEYLKFLLGKRNSPERPKTLSYIAAQAVRISLEEFFPYPEKNPTIRGQLRMLGRFTYGGIGYRVAERPRSGELLWHQDGEQDTWHSVEKTLKAKRLPLAFRELLARHTGLKTPVKNPTTIPWKATARYGQLGTAYQALVTMGGQPVKLTVFPARPTPTNKYFWIAYVGKTGEGRGLDGAANSVETAKTKAERAARKLLRTTEKNPHGTKKATKRTGRRDKTKPAGTRRDRPQTMSPWKTPPTRVEVSSPCAAFDIRQGAAYSVTSVASFKGGATITLRRIRGSGATSPVLWVRHARHLNQPIFDAGYPPAADSSIDLTHRAGFLVVQRKGDEVKSYKRNVAKRPSPTKAQLAKVASIFRALRKVAARYDQRVMEASLKADSTIHVSPRAFAMTRVANGKVDVRIAPELALEPKNVQVGVLQHELAHALAGLMGAKAPVKPPTSKAYDAIERHADKIAEKVFKTKIYYDKRGVETTAKGTRPRPAGLR